MSENFLWKFEWDCDTGKIESLFVATEEKVNSLINQEIDFGEALGKHSEVEGTIEKGEIIKIDIDPETVRKVTKILGYTWAGYNLFNYINLDND